MNIDRLIKFIELATNNPNEHEANLAARRVCNMLAVDNFKWIRAKVMFKMHPTQEDFIRRTEPPKPEYKSQYYTEPSNPDFKSYVDEIFKNINYRWTKDDDFFSRLGNNPNLRYEERPNNNKIKLKCKTCGETKETRYRGAPELWVCMECRGKEYQK